jgi:hypothetical protein
LPFSRHFIGRSVAKTHRSARLWGFREKYWADARTSVRPNVFDVPDNHTRQTRRRVTGLEKKKKKKEKRTQRDAALRET